MEKLVQQLHEQSRLLDVPSEIILIDDCSEKKFRASNRKNYDNIRYIQLDKNIGRASIRNLFLKYTHYDYLLFLDCDSIVHKDDFLKNYITTIQQHPNCVICGGRVYDKKKPSRNKRLRWKYGIKKESKPFEVRSQHPNVSFMTNNFVINRKVFETIRFDERLVLYGHEDTLFGFELKKNNIKIHHIDNPIINGDVEDNTEYLRKTEQALVNLVVILERTNYNNHLINDISILHFFYKYYWTKRMITVGFFLTKRLIKFFLSKGFVNLYWFDFYKLGILNEQLNKSDKKTS